MAKAKDAPISADDIQQFLSSRSDFDLELFVHRCAAQAGMSVTHGGTYEDPATRKARQYDVRAAIDSERGRLALAIECKALKASFPLVISRVPRTQSENFHDLALSRARGAGRVVTVGAGVPEITMTSGRALRIDDSPLYPLGALVGKATAQVGKTDKDEFVSSDADVYDKWAQALTSAHDLVESAMTMYDRTRQGGLTLVLPVLVVSDGTLWVADYSDQGSIQGAPRQVPEAMLFVGREYYGPTFHAMTVSHLHVYTRSGIEQWFSVLSTHRGSWWDAAFPKRRIEIAMRSV